MRETGRLTLCSLAFCLTYTLAYYTGWSPFAYFPAEAQFRLWAQSGGTEPAILWYGWLAVAAAAGLAALAVPRRWAARVPPDLSWLIGAVLVVAALVYEKRWFF
jgi:hypothetical protein